MIPRFCPHPSCRYHRSHKPPPGWYRSAGTYRTRAFGTVRRFQCTHCYTYFSTQTFSIDYYAKRPVSYRRLLTHLITTSSIRDAARDFGISVDSVLNKLERFARNCLITLQQLLSYLSLEENLVTDGFESFTVSQFFPCHINVLAGAGSELLYGFNYVTLRRKGRMTEAQKLKREALERVFRADPKGVERAMSLIFDRASVLIDQASRHPVLLISDKHRAYRRAFARHRRMQCLREQKRAKHLRFDSTSPRTHANPLFPVNYLDRQFRKDLCEHVRQTVCFGRNVNRVMDRVAIYAVYHNLIKPYREARGIRCSHAEAAGVAPETVRRLLYGLFNRRAFATKVPLDPMYRRIWRREYVTPLKMGVERVPKHALAFEP